MRFIPLRKGFFIFIITAIQLFLESYNVYDFNQGIQCFLGLRI